MHIVTPVALHERGDRCVRIANIPSAGPRAGPLLIGCGLVSLGGIGEKMAALQSRLGEIDTLTAYFVARIQVALVVMTPQ